jgi:hypothetical protein
MTAIARLRTHADMSALVSQADISQCNRHVRFTPKSGHVRCNLECPLWAISGHRQSSKKKDRLAAISPKFVLMFNQAASAAVFFFMHAPNPLANNGSQEVAWRCG